MTRDIAFCYIVFARTYLYMFVVLRIFPNLNLYTDIEITKQDFSLTCHLRWKNCLTFMRKKFFLVVSAERDVL